MEIVILALLLIAIFEWRVRASERRRREDDEALYARMQEHISRDLKAMDKRLREALWECVK